MRDTKLIIFAPIIALILSGCSLFVSAGEGIEYPPPSDAYVEEMTMFVEETFLVEDVVWDVEEVRGMNDIFGNTPLLGYEFVAKTSYGTEDLPIGEELREQEEKIWEEWNTWVKNNPESYLSRHIGDIYASDAEVAAAEGIIGRSEKSVSELKNDYREAYEERQLAFTRARYKWLSSIIQGQDTGDENRITRSRPEISLAVKTPMGTECVIESNLPSSPEEPESFRISCPIETK